MASKREQSEDRRKGYMRYVLSHLQENDSVLLAKGFFSLEAILVAESNFNAFTGNISSSNKSFLAAFTGKTAPTMLTLEAIQKAFQIPITVSKFEKEILINKNPEFTKYLNPNITQERIILANEDLIQTSQQEDNTAPKDVMGTTGEPVTNIFIEPKELVAQKSELEEKDNKVGRAKQRRQVVIRIFYGLFNIMTGLFVMSILLKKNDHIFPSKRNKSVSVSNSTDTNDFNANKKPKHKYTLTLKCEDCIEEPIVVQIGSQLWMANNLNEDKYADGSEIPEAKTSSEWIKYGYEKKGCWCYYDNDQKHGELFGKLYNWHVANDTVHGGISPPGWHIPNSAILVTS